MIKLFRNIRKKRLDEDKTASYIKYAIGEILLVVIGILIALQVNNWNSNRNTHRQQEKLLNQLLVDLKQSENELKEIVTFFDARARASANVSQSFWTKAPMSDSLLTNFILPMSNRRYRPNLSIMSSLINSGDIQLIKSVDIRSAITFYYESVNSELDDIIRYEEQYYRKGIDQVHGNMDYASFSLAYRTDEYLEEMRERNDGLVLFPEKFDTVPFPVELEKIYGNGQIYNGYKYLFIGHRNVSWIYSDILKETQKLIELLQEEGYGKKD